MDLVRRLREYGLKACMYKSREGLQRRLSPPESLRGLRCIVAAGGDGTVTDVINRFPGIPLAILPLGTENLLAKYLGVQPCGRFVADMIALGNTQRLDLCQVVSAQKGNRRFTLVASAGFDADVIHRLQARRQGNITHWSYAQPIWSALREYQHPIMRVYIDDEPEPVPGRVMICANLPVYAFNLPIARSARGDDALLDLRLFERGSTVEMLRYMYHIACRSHEHLPDVTARPARRIRLESDVPIPIQVDGDPHGHTPISIDVLPQALEVYIPSPQQLV